MGDRVICETDALSEERPGRVLRGGQVAHGAVPKSPPGLNFSVGLGVVAAGGSTLGSGDRGNGGHEFAQEFRGVVRVDDVGRAATKMDFIQQTRYEGGGLAIGKGGEDHSLGEAVDQGQGFGLARGGKALALKIHRIAGTWFVSGVGSEQSVC